jgi:hypothetical protein
VFFAVVLLMRLRAEILHRERYTHWVAERIKS